MATAMPGERDGLAARRDGFSTASPTVRPRASSSRKRLTMNSE